MKIITIEVHNATLIFHSTPDIGAFESHAIYSNQPTEDLSSSIKNWINLVPAPPISLGECDLNKERAQQTEITAEQREESEQIYEK